MSKSANEKLLNVDSTDCYFVNSENKQKEFSESIENNINDKGSILLIVHTAAWCGGCLTFKNNLKTYYEKWNEDGDNVRVLIVSGDKD